MKQFCCIHILLTLLCAKHIQSVQVSTVVGISGHYPPMHCKLTNSILDIKNRAFKIYGESTEKVHAQCHHVAEVWPIESRQLSEKPVNCSVHFKEGHAFTVYYWSGISNYFHLTYDMMLPLYKQIYYDKDKLGASDSIKSGELLFMPTVETQRLKVLDWDTPAFSSLENYWVQMAKFMAGNHSFKPLDKSILTTEGDICFDELYLGTAKVDFGDADFIQSFVHFVKSSIGIRETSVLQHRLAFVSRKRRRKILNENEVVDSLQSVIKTDLVEFSGMNFAEQVETVQKYSVFAALNGAGLMNGLYLPKHAVVIQMVPYQAQLNVKAYGILLKSRGPYLEWHNKREELTQTVPGDKYNTMPNTIVDIEDFKKTVKEAIHLYDKSTVNVRDEL